MSAGRQGSKSSRRSCISKGGAGAARGGGVDAGAEALEAGAQLRVELGLLALGRAADAQRAHQPVDRQPRRPAISETRPGDDAAVEVHLPEPVLPVAEALGEPEVVERAGARCGARPSGRGATSTGPRQPRHARSSPSCCGSGRRKSASQSPAAGRRGERAARPAPRAPSRSADRLRVRSPSGYWMAGRQLARSARQRALGLELLEVGLHRHRGRRAQRARGRRPRPRRAAPRASARRARARRADAARGPRGARRTRRPWRPGR